MAEPLHTITIRLYEGGKLNVEGPVQDKLLTYGMLQLAMEAVRLMRNQPQIYAPGPEEVAKIGGRRN